MTEKQVKGYVEAAENDHSKQKDEAIEKAIKQIVQDTLEKIEQLEKQIEKLQDEKKQLKTTIDDLKSGNLKLLKEKLDKDPKAKEAVHIKIVEVIQPVYIERPVNPWYKPYEITWCSNFNAGSAVGGWSANNATNIIANSSEVKNATLGTYCLLNGTSVTLR